jgi:hypothetical protein
MAKANMGAWDGFTGRNGDFVIYIRMGKVVKRRIGRSTKPATKDQRRSRAKVGIANNFISSVRGFINFGMKLEGKIQKKTPNDLMLSHVMSNGIIKGEYPNQMIDFSAVQFSKGSMQETPDLKVIPNALGLEFSWDISPVPGQFRKDDKLMVLVYFPELKSAEFDTHAAKRSEGNYLFKLDKNEKPVLMETYASFMSADEKSISATVYLGQFILPAYEQ